MDFPPPWTFRRLGLKDLVQNVKDLAKLKDLCGKGNAWTPRAEDHGRKVLTNEIARGCSIDKGLTKKQGLGQENNKGLTARA